MENSKNKQCISFKLCAVLLLLLLLFIYLLLGLCCCTQALSSCGQRGGYPLLRCAGFSLRWLLLLRSADSSRTGFSSCGALVLLLLGMWDLPGPGLEPVSPALAGGFLTTAPPGKSPVCCFE